MGTIVIQFSLDSKPFLRSSRHLAHTLTLPKGTFANPYPTRHAETNKHVTTTKLKGIRKLLYHAGTKNFAPAYRSAASIKTNDTASVSNALRGVCSDKDSQAINAGNTLSNSCKLLLGALDCIATPQCTAPMKASITAA